MCTMPLSATALTWAKKREQTQRVNVADESSAPNIDRETFLDESRSSREAPLASKHVEHGDEDSSSAARDECDQDHGPRTRSYGLVRVGEDGIDSESRHSHDAGESIDETEEGFAREVREREEERNGSGFRCEDRNQS